MLTKIDNVTINVHAGAAASPFVKAFLDALQAAPATSTELTVSQLPPAIGQPWPEQGGIYGGIVRGEDGAPDSHIVLSEAKPDGDLSWQAALDWARTVGAPEHSDFALPTRFQSAVLYGNLRDRFEQTGWHWTSSEHSERHAWVQYFGGGIQYSYVKSYEARARAVRLIPLTA